MENYDAVIVGAGPAGLKCAEVLAQNNKKVLVLEKNKLIGEKACAGGIVLNNDNLGLPRNLAQRRFSSMIFHTPHQTTEVKVDKPFITIIDRQELGECMAKQAIGRGVEIRTKALVTGITEKFVTVNGKEKVSYNYLVGADGSLSSVRKHLGLQTDLFLEAFHYTTEKRFSKLELFFNPDKFGPYYLWIFPHQGYTSIGTGAGFEKNVNRKISALSVTEIKKNLDFFCRDKFDIGKSEFKAATINCDYKGHDFGNKFLIGDAAGIASELTGVGINSAILSGEDVARRIIDSKYPCYNIEHILRIKRFHNRIVRTLKINKTMSKSEFELIALMFKSKNVFKMGLRLI